MLVFVLESIQVPASLAAKHCSLTACPCPSHTLGMISEGKTCLQEIPFRPSWGWGGTSHKNKNENKTQHSDPKINCSNLLLFKILIQYPQSQNILLKEVLESNDVMMPIFPHFVAEAASPEWAVTQSFTTA